MQRMINGISVHTFGKATNQAIVFIHGFPFDHTLWDDVIDEFKDEYYCISYDIRGFGKSEIETAQFTMESYVQDLESVVLGLKLNKPIICGFSMGGYIALRANERENYKALILANTATNSDSDEAKLKRAAGISNIDAKGLEPFIDAFFSAAFSEDFVKEEPLKIKDKVMNTNSIAIKAALLAMISRTDTTQSLNKIDIPVLLITSENDKIIPKETMEQMASKIKNSTLVSLSESGHVSMIENPDEFKSAVRSFLQSLCH
ncbi:hydrolase, alpha/beta fold family [Sulfurimonas gotlandica GD1]|uniref:Hydrolase, alpha/beta fold family n=1 Tax=Sulfurimonas gotlandica (strain DSM 19862 / JCM 16533 / GD1) TaxID=929558 RepID=B6BLE3_SULGG|nr:alpha/beta hydrolase [Sulfurimonas gotlandica]EDZ62118.1 alpha/beta hydrolase fold [Sulfurimonas gotlandica GD1]EHP28597.1 hydrolase, alpha/beta fold family [Sulfurimonas gotlandica GD1]